ncbi:MAG: hypothetical protein ACPGJS_18935 [Flammeovirgaceae bacterium]
MIPQQAFTLIVKIKAGHTKTVKDILAKIHQETGEIRQGRSPENPLVPFQDCKTIHFARWFVMDNLKDTTGQPFQDMLGFTSNYDGDAAAHYNELSKHLGKGFDELYQHTEGYPESPTEQSRVNFFKKQNIQPRLFWGAMRGYTVADIRDEGKLRDGVEQWLRKEVKQEDWEKLSPTEARDRIVNFVKSSEFSWAMKPVPGPSLGWKIKYWGKLVIIFLIAILLAVSLIMGLKGIITGKLALFWKVTAAISWAVVIWFGIWLLLERMFEIIDDYIRERTPEPVDDEERYRELLELEDYFFQNQLTVYGTIKKPYWFRRTTLKIALYLFLLNGTYRSTKGKLAGIPTIHFARWIIFNNQKNVMFLSNYNGNWENYLSQFIEQSASAMNVTFGQMVGYPQIKWFLGGGAHDEQKFKKVVRQNQYPSQVYYSAYPDLTVRNVLNNSYFRKGLIAKMKDDEARKDWLSRVY